MAATNGQTARRAAVQMRGAMRRRSLLWGLISAVGGAFAASGTEAGTKTPATGKLKVVYHLNDLDKVSFVLGNIQNHFAGVVGPDHAPLQPVLHRPALTALV